MSPHFGLRVDALLLLLAWIDDESGLCLARFPHPSAPFPCQASAALLFCLLRHARLVGVTYMDYERPDGPSHQVPSCGMAWHGMAWCAVWCGMATAWVDGDWLLCRPPCSM